MSEKRCRLVMTLRPGAVAPAILVELAGSGALYCAILYADKACAEDFPKFCEMAVPVFRDKSIPVLIANDTRLMGRTGADGVFIEGDRRVMREVIEQYQEQRIIGAGSIRDRHGALEIGEMAPDFVFFGKLGGDIKPEAHPKNVALAEWWSQIVEIPCILMAGSDFDSILDCARTGADFVAVERAVLDQDSPAKALARAEALLEEHAPRFEEVDA